MVNCWEWNAPSSVELVGRPINELGVEASGLTFYVFEAQGRRELDLATVDHFNLPDELQGAQADFFLAIGAPSPFPFVLDRQRKNVPLIEVAYGGIGLGPDKRDIFMRLLRQVRSR